MVFNNFSKYLLVSMVVIVSVFTGCKKSTYYQLTDEEMTWLSYTNNEVLTFNNGSGDQLRYYVTLRTKSYMKDDDTYSEFTTAEVLQLNDTTYLYYADTYGGLFIFKGENGLLVSFTWPHFALKGIPLTSLIPTYETIGGVIYDDVFVIDSSGLTDLRNYNRIIWVSKTRGVLQIEDTSGNIWVREF